MRYARSGDVSIAYQTVGDGPVDVVFVPFLINLIWAWEQPIFVDFCRRMSAFSRLILLDKRGTGLSDRPRDMPTFEARLDDIRAVMDDAGSERAALLGAGSPGGQLCAVFAATYPERVAALLPPQHLAARGEGARLPVRRAARGMASARARGAPALGLVRLPARGDAQVLPELRGRPGVRALAREPRAPGREPGCGRLVHARADGDRHPRGAAGDLRAHADDVQRALPRRLRADGGADPERGDGRAELARHQHLRGSRASGRR